MFLSLLFGLATTGIAKPQAAPTKIGIFDLAAIRSVPLDAQVVKKIELDGVVTEEIRFTTLPGIRVFAYLSYPKGGKKLGTNITVRNSGADDRRREGAIGFAGWSVCAPEGNTDPEKKLTVGGPHNTLAEQFTDDPKQSWIYNHVIAQLRGLDYLATRPEIDMKRVVVEGFSWSGFVTALWHAIDNRPACFVTWNSTGYFSDLNGMSGSSKSRISRKMYEMYAPSYYAQYGTQPIFVGNSLTDYFATLDGAIETYKKLRCPKRFVWAPNRYHADTSRKEYSSAGAYMWSFQGNGPKTPTITEGVVVAQGGKLLYKYKADSSEKPERAEVLFSFGAPGHWTGRTWHRRPATLVGAEYVAEIPVFDPSVPLYAVGQIETKSFRASGNCPQYIEPKSLGITASTAEYPKTLFSFEDKDDLYFGSGDPTWIADAAEGKVAASVEPFSGDSTVHLLNIEPFFWKGATSLCFYLKGDGKAGQLNLYLTRDTSYYLDREGGNYVKFPIVPPNGVFKEGWQFYQINLNVVPRMNEVDSLYFEAPGRKLVIDGVRWQ